MYMCVCVCVYYRCVGVRYVPISVYGYDTVSVVSACAGTMITSEDVALDLLKRHSGIAWDQGPCASQISTSSRDTHRCRCQNLIGHIVSPMHRQKTTSASACLADFSGTECTTLPSNTIVVLFSRQKEKNVFFANPVRIARN